MSKIQVVVDGVVKMEIDGTVVSSTTPVPPNPTPVPTPPPTPTPATPVPVGFNPPIPGLNLWNGRWNVGEIGKNGPVNLSAKYIVPDTWPSAWSKLIGTPTIEISPSGFYNSGLQMFIDGKPFDGAPFAWTDLRASVGEHILSISVVNWTEGSIDFYK